MSGIQLGVMAALEEGADEALRKVRSLEFPTCQLSCWHDDLFTEAGAEELLRAIKRYNVQVTTLWTGAPGRYVWDFLQGPSTIGLVPPATRARRLQALKRGSDFARLTGIRSITTHVGFIPENPADPDYAGTLQALKEIAAYCAQNGQEFWFETGQETPVTLLRTIQDIGAPNLGVNLDPANLLLYGKANPVDALDIIGPYVRGVHAKDGEYPTEGRNLGQEKPLGQGRVNFPALIAKLVALGFKGALTIEREISGPQQIADIQAGKRFLEGILEEYR